MSSAWTAVDRLRACKDRRAKLLLSLADGGGGAGAAPPLAEHNLSLLEWHAKAPGEQVQLLGRLRCSNSIAEDTVCTHPRPLVRRRRHPANHPLTPPTPHWVAPSQAAPCLLAAAASLYA